MSIDYIVDASVIMQRLIRDNYTQNAQKLFEEGATHKLHIPEFALLECVNVLWKQVRFYNMPQELAQQNIIDLIDLPLHPLAVSKMFNQALKIGLKHQLAIYDSIYIALSIQLQFPLITVDRAQDQAAKLEGVTVKPITDFVL